MKSVHSVLLLKHFIYISVKIAYKKSTMFANREFLTSVPELRMVVIFTQVTCVLCHGRKHSNCLEKKLLTLFNNKFYPTISHCSFSPLS